MKPIVGLQMLESLKCDAQKIRMVVRGKLGEDIASKLKMKGGEYEKISKEY